MEISVVTHVEKGVIPDKLYFKIGEVCEITDIKSHTLRFWESEFKLIKPKRVSGNQRLYRHVDIETILRIKHLIYEEGHTLAGAKKRLSSTKKSIQKKQRSVSPQIDSGLIKKIKTDLKELRTILEK
jgi:DNA-binding transcriptional MerR regulator